MDHPLPLDNRKQQILKAVVSDYTETGVPVGSQAIAAKLLASWSSATIRNELATLVEVGYLLQPHTSAGRIPTDRGYRYYVDFLMEEELVSPAVRRQVDPFLARPTTDVEALLESAAQVLALVTESVSIVTGPQSLSARVKHLDLVSLDPRHVLVIVLLEGNLLRQQVVALGRPAEQEELSGLAAELNVALRGRDVSEVEAADRVQGDAQPSPLRDEVLSHLARLMHTIQERQDTVVVHDGVRNLLRQPEFEDVGRLQQVVDLVEEERALGQLLTTIDLADGVHIVIGAENEFEELRACSLVLTTYRAGDTRRGTIGILGPTRMRYPQVAPRLRYVSQRVGQAIDRMLG